MSCALAAAKADEAVEAATDAPETATAAKAALCSARARDPEAFWAAASAAPELDVSNI